MINPSRIRILAVGKVRKGWVLEGIATYLKRLPGLQVVELRDAGKEREAAAILEALIGRGRSAVAALGPGKGLEGAAAIVESLARRAA